jgi:hypothetical protein
MMLAPEPSGLEIRQARTYRAALALAAVVLCVAAFVMLHSARAPLVGDYAEWTYHGVLLRDVLQGHPDAGYALKNYPVPNSLTTVGLGLLMLALPWKIAAKLWLLCEVALGLFAAWQLQKAAGRAQAWQVLVLPAAMLLGTTFWFGFTNFMFGVFFAMLVCALLLREVQSRWMYAALLLLAFFSHMIPFAFAGLAVVLYALERRRLRLLWQLLPAVVLSGWYFVGRGLHGDADAHAGMASSVPFFTPLFAAFKANSYLKCWGFVNPAATGHDSVLLRLVAAKIFVVLFVLNMLIAVAVFVLIAVAAWRALREKTRGRFLWAAIAIFFVAGVVLPGAAAGISDPGGRMIQIAVWTGVCLVSVRWQWLRVGLVACGIVLATADCYELQAVAMQPPMVGSATQLPERVRDFGHVYYAHQAADYDAIEAGKMSVEIYPTAMFLEKRKQ